MKIKVKCSWCGKILEKYPSRVKNNKNFYCSSECRSKHLSKEFNPEGYLKHPKLSILNLELNKTRMTEEVKDKLRKSRLGKGERKSYPKLFGKHIHRIVAEEKIGRKLKKGEVVHHIDGNKQNNTPDNLMVFSSQAEHARWHKEHDIER